MRRQSTRALVWLVGAGLVLTALAGGGILNATIKSTSGNHALADTGTADHARPPLDLAPPAQIETATFALG
jgi:hypothetical protein